MSSTQAKPNAIIMVFTGMLVALVVIVYGRLAYGLILPPMRADLGLSYQQAGSLGTITALGYLLFVLAGGVAASRWGSRRAVLLGLAAVTLGFAGLALASKYWLIVVLMALLGFGTAFTFAPMISLLATWYPEQRGLVIGCMSAGIGAGMFIIGLLVPWLYTLFGANGWRVTWGVFAATAAVAMLLVFMVVRDPPLAHSDASARPPSADKWLIYRNSRVLTVATVYGIVGLTYIVQAIFMISFMVDSGFSEATAGWMMAMMGLLSMASGPLWGRLSDVLGRANALTGAMSLVTVAMLLPLFAQSLPVFFVHFFLMGCAVNGMFTMIQAASTDQVAPRYIPIAFSFVTLFFAGGQFIGPAMAGWLIEWSGSFEIAIASTCVWLIVGLYLTQRIRRFPPGLAVA
jgi:MFS family permease